MISVPALVDAMQSTITTTATTYARSSGFTQRESKLTAAAFCETLIFGWLERPDATLPQLCATALIRGVTITPQGLDQRFTVAGAAVLHHVLDAVTDLVIPAPVSAPPDLLQRFAGVFIDDATVIGLPDALETVWQGCGGRTDEGGKAALKLQVRWDLSDGALYGPFLQDGRTSDQHAPTQEQDPVPGTLRIADLGFFNLDVLADQDASGAYWLSRLDPQTTIIDDQDRAWRGASLPTLLESVGGDIIDLPIRLGKRKRIPCRLLAVRVPPAVAAARRQWLEHRAERKGQAVSPASLAMADWTIMVTNVPSEHLSVVEAVVLLRLRWQVELLFKLWKSHGSVDTWRSENPERILCEVYAKLIGLVMRHWLSITACWDRVDRSLVQAAQRVQSYAHEIARAFGSRRRLCRIIRDLHASIRCTCRMNRRRKHPAAWQLLLDPTLTPLA